jgi:SNF2 family DNA or RNA helicase
MADMFASLYAETTSTDEPADNLASSNKTVLIVCPSSLVYNWTNELQRFAPTLSICQYTGSVAERNKKADNLVLWDVVITTYHTALNDIDILATINFGIAVFDESQMFKNRNSQIYAAMSNITAEYRVALSGTPMENSLSELWSLMSVLNPLLLGDFKTFNKNFATPISENLLDTRSDILKKTIAPYFLRRTKEQVLADLPERQDEIIMCEMTDDQHSLYEEKMSAARNLAVSEKANDMSILAAIGRLRQIANHPQLIHEEDTDECNYDFRMSGKTMAIFSQMETVRGTKHKVLLFSEYVSFLNIIAKEMDRRGWKYEILTGETKNREQVINRFSNDENIQFFLISLKAGGVGLNLTCADYVFLLNPWWNKAAEEQAISRVHRIGQKHPIFVYRFVTRNTLEEKILLLQDHKQSLIESVMPFLK